MEQVTFIKIYVLFVTADKVKVKVRKAVPLHAMEALGGR
jgi:hypothetical protein